MDFEPRIVICGTYRKELNKLKEIYLLLSKQAEILFPKDLDFICEDQGFVYRVEEIGQTPHSIELKHLSAVDSADFVWLHCPAGYVGKSGAFEIGYAASTGIPIYALEAPSDVTLRGFVTVIKDPQEAIEKHITYETYSYKPPIKFLESWQDYYRMIAHQRGYDQEDVRDCLILLQEELGELAHAIRKSRKIVRHGSYRETDIGIEIADIFLYILHLSNILDISLADAVKLKESINYEKFLKAKESEKVNG